MTSKTKEATRHPSWLCIFIALLIVICCDLRVSRAAPSSAAPSSEILENFIKRLIALQNIEVRFRLESQYSPTPEWLGRHVVIMGQDRSVDFKARHSSFIGNFAFLNEDALFEMTASDATLAEALQQKRDVVGYKCIMTSDRVDTLYHHLNGPRSLGSIVGNKRAPDNALIDVALGLRTWGGQSWLAQQDLQNAVVDTDQSNSTIELRGSDNYVHRWLFDHDLKTPVQYSVNQANMPPFVIFEFKKFVKVQGMMLPIQIQITRQVMRRDLQGNEKGLWPIESDDITVLDYKINAADNTQDKYLMVWPKGSRVLDARTNEEFDIRSGNRTLTDKEIYELDKAKLENATSRPATSQP